jgi:hypothetical protein
MQYVYTKIDIICGKNYKNAESVSVYLSVASVFV